MLLPDISIEQNNIIKQLSLNYNVIVDSVAGSGKTTCNLHIAKYFNNKKILLLTYNSKLKIETREKIKKLNLNNIEVHSYHSFCVKYYDNDCFNDTNITIILKNNSLVINKFNYDLIVLDEAQDISTLYYHLICKIFKDNNNLNTQICIFGDKKQSIFNFNNADERFIEYANDLFKFNSNKWIKCYLSTSFRITNEMSLFINKCLLNEDRIISNKITNNKPRYIICDCFNYNKPLEEIKYYLNLGYKPDDIFILAPSVKSLNTPIRILENNIKINMPNIMIYVPINDDEKLDDDLLKGKLIFSTFHQTKGLERKVVIIFNFDNSYFKFYNKNVNPLICSNELYVATTRGLEHLTLFHHYYNDFLNFIDKSIIQNYCYFEGFLSINNKNIKKNINISITNICKFLPQYVIDNCFNELNIISNDDYILSKINIPLKILNENTIESVSDITGIAIPSMFELTIKNKLTIFDFINNKEFIKFISNKEIINKLYNIDIINIKPDELLFISNCWNSYKNGYLFKSYQITNYDWLEEKELNLFIKRLNKLNISNKCKFEYKLNVEKEIYNLNGYIDCIDEENNIVYEFKCVQKLEKEHYIQLALYMYMYELQKKNKKKINKTKYVLFNILNNEYKIIDCEYKKLRKMVKYLLHSKYNNCKKLSNKDFINNNLNIFKLYF
jgi:hypothetical protein